MPSIVKDVSAIFVARITCHMKIITPWPICHRQISLQDGGTSPKAKYQFIALATILKVYWWPLTAHLHNPNIPTFSLATPSLVKTTKEVKLFTTTRAYFKDRSQRTNPPMHCPWAGSFPKLLLTELSWSVWENFDRDPEYRPNALRSVNTTKVKILPQAQTD